MACFLLQKLKKDLDAANKGLAAARKQLEDETILRVDLENRIQSLKEDLAFKTQVHEQVRYEICYLETFSLKMHVVDNLIGAPYCSSQ
jgi:hypothetical protein